MSTGTDIGSEAERRAQGVVELIVPELEEALAFYVVVGFEVERLTADFAALQGHGCRLFLARDRAAQPVRGCNLRVIVDNVDALHQRLVHKQVPVVRAPADRGYGLRDFSVMDPHGFVLRFAQVIDVTTS